MSACNGRIQRIITMVYLFRLNRGTMLRAFYRVGSNDFSHIISLLLILLVTGVAAQEHLPVYPVYEENPCPFPSLETVTCGTLTVYEDRTTPDSQTIQLAVAVIAAQSPDPEPDPIIYLEGGPGGSALIAVEGLLNHPLRENRDLILFDQRGAGFSQPSLNCIEIESPNTGFQRSPIESCYLRLQRDGINLNRYTSADSAADVNDLRVAMGYEQVNLYGISYGARLALTVMRDYPDSVRAAVLDSVLPPEVNRYERSASDTLTALRYFFDQCAADTVCQQAYPSLEHDFYVLVAAFNDTPAVVPV